jgi:hypothetical protein
MRLTAVECLRRGLGSLAANWELVPIQWLGSLLVAALMVAGLAVPVAMLEGGLDLSAREAARSLTDLFQALGDLSPVLLLGLVALLALWTAAFLLHCYIQAGTYGVLLTADRQAPPSRPGSKPRAGRPRARALFRTFSRTDFFGWGGRYVWRFFGLVNLFWVLLLVVALGTVLWLAFIVAGGERWGSTAALGIGCGGVLPLGFLTLVFAFGFSVAQADLAREDSGVWVAFRVGFSVLGRRLGAVLLVYLVFLAAAVALSVLFIPASLAADTLLGDAPGMHALAQIFLLFVQGIPSALLSVALAAALVALVRSEIRSETRVKPEVQIA